MREPRPNKYKDQMERGLLSAILDTVGALVVVLDRKGRIIGFNQGCERTTGYSSDEVAGKYVWDLFLIPEEVEPVRAVFAGLNAGEFPNEFENYWVTREGERRLISWSNTALLDAEGEAEYVIGTGIDITERRRAEEALRASEEAWRSLAEHSPDQIMLLDPEAKIRFINHTLPELSQEQVIGTSFFDYALEEYRQPAQECFARVLETGQPDQFESVYLDADGNKLAFESYVGPVMRSGEVWGLTVRSTNITEHKRAGEALERLSHDLGERVKELNCLYGISALVEKPDITLGEILQGTVDLVPPAWQHPEITCARVVLDGQEFSTENFRETEWQQTCDIQVNGKGAGRVQVCYLEERRQIDEGPFLREERSLVEAIAQRLGGIAERVRAEETLKHSEQRYAQAQRAANIGSWDWDIPAGDLHWSDLSEAIFGFGRGEFGASYEAFLDRVHPDDRQHVTEAVDACVGRSADYAIEHRIVWPDGTVRWVSETGDVIRDEGGAAIRMLGIVQEITERKQAEEQIRQQNEFLTDILESLTHPFYVVDARDYTVQIANSAALREGLAGKVTCYALTHGRSSPCGTADHPCPLEEIKRTKEPVTVEHIHFDPDGNARYVEVHGYPLFDQEGDVVQVIEYALDTTERREAEEALRDSEKRHRGLLDALQEGIWVIDQDARTTFVNPRMAEMLGYTMEEMQGQHLSFFMDERGAEITERNLQRRQQGIKEQHDFEFLRKDGSRIYTTLETAPIFDDGGNYVGGIAGVQDITERRRMEEALRESEARWRSVTENSPDHVVLLDANLRIQFVNYASPGLTQEELLGTPLYTHVAQERQYEIKEILTNILGTAEPASYETEYSTPDGGVICYESRVVPRILDGKVIGLAVNARDITERKRAEQALREAKQTAEDARREERERRQEAVRRRQIAESLADVLAALNSNQPLDKVLELIVVQARRLLDSEAVAIFRLQDEAGTLAFQAAHGLPGSCIAGATPPPGLEILGQAIASCRPAVVPNLAEALPDDGSQAQGVGRMESATSETELCQALLAVPIVVKGQVYGGIAVYYGEPRAFSDEDLELAIVFADQVGLAIENARLREQVQEAAVAAERSRLARDLHDSVTQALFSASLVAEVLPQVWQRDPDEAQQGLQELRHLTRGALAEMRTMLLELRPTALVETRLDDLLRQLTEAVASRAQLEILLNVDPVPTLTPDVHVTFYRAAQEALHNTVKHAEASQVTVSLRTSPPAALQQGGDWQGQVILRVSDDGRGFDPARTGPDQMGLRIMRERAEAVGARLDIECQPGQGTQVTLVWASR